MLARDGQHLAEPGEFGSPEPVVQQVGHSLRDEAIVGTPMTIREHDLGTVDMRLGEKGDKHGKPSSQFVLPALAAIRHSIRSAPTLKLS